MGKPRQVACRLARQCSHGKAASQRPGSRKKVLALGTAGKPGQQELGRSSGGRSFQSQLKDPGSTQSGGWVYSTQSGSNMVPPGWVSYSPRDPVDSGLCFERVSEVPGVPFRTFPSKRNSPGQAASDTLWDIPKLRTAVGPGRSSACSAVKVLRCCLHHYEERSAAM